MFLCFQDSIEKTFTSLTFNGLFLRLQVPSTVGLFATTCDLFEIPFFFFTQSSSLAPTKVTRKNLPASKGRFIDYREDG